MLVKFLLCGLASLTIGLKSTAIEKSSIKDGSYVNGRFYSESFLNKVINNLDNEESASNKNLGDTLGKEKNIDVVVELYDTSGDDLLINEDNYHEIMTIKKNYIKKENDRIFNLLNLNGYASYYKCENIPFLNFKYNQLDDFYKFDLYKLSKFESNIKNVFITK